MNGPIRAMMWELWRTGRMDIAARLGYTLLIVAGIGTVSGRGGENVPLSARGVIVLLSVIAGIGSIAWIRELDRSQEGFNFRLAFARPVRTSELVAIPMLFTAMLAAVCYLLPVSVFSLIGGVSVPVLAPLAFVVCVAVCFTGMAWGTKTLTDRAIGLAAMTTIVALAIVGMHSRSDAEEPFLLAIGNPDYYRDGWLYYGSIVAVTLSAFAATTVSVGQQRCGTGFSLSERLGSLLQSKAEAKTNARPFRSRVAAQFAYEFRNCSVTTLLFGLAGPLAIYVVIKFSLWINPDRITTRTLFEGTPVMWMLGLTLSPAVYQLIATDAALGLRARTGTHRFLDYDATRPMTNGELVVIKLTAITVCAFLAWIPMWCGALLYTAFGADGQIMSEIVETVQTTGPAPWYAWPAGICTATLLYVSGSCMLLTFGLWMPLYAKRFIGLCCFGYLQIALAFCAARYAWNLESFWHACAYVEGGIVVFFAVRTIANGLRHEAISTNVFLAVLAAWLVMVVSILAIVFETGLTERISLPVASALAALLCIPLAAPAAAPMAFRAQRHQ